MGQRETLPFDVVGRGFCVSGKKASWTGPWREGILPSLARRQAPLVVTGRKESACQARQGRQNTFPPGGAMCVAGRFRDSMALTSGGACRTWLLDGSLEGGHSAFPGAPSGALTVTGERKRLSALGKAECLPSEDRPSPRWTGCWPREGEAWRSRGAASLLWKSLDRCSCSVSGLPPLQGLETSGAAGDRCGCGSG